MISYGECMISLVIQTDMIIHSGNRSVKGNDMNIGTVTDVPKRPGRDDEGRLAVAAALRAEMARQGISQRQLSDQLGHTQQWIQQRTSGKTPITSDDFRRLALVLSLTPREFLERLSVELEPIDLALDVRLPEEDL